MDVFMNNLWKLIIQPLTYKQVFCLKKNIIIRDRR